MKTMEVSNEIKEEISKTQADLKNAIRIHQIWVARLQEDENNTTIKSKVKQAENEIITIGQTQKLVVDRLRRELELYQQRLKARTNRVNTEYDNRYVAKQLRDYQINYRNRNRSSLLKPSVLNEILIKSENNNEDDAKEILSDSESEIKLSNDKENNSDSNSNDKSQYPENFTQLQKTVLDSRSKFASVLNKVKESFIGNNHRENGEWQDHEPRQYQEQRSDSDSSRVETSPTPSPPPLPKPGEPITKEIFLRLLGLITPMQREALEKKRNERRKRAKTSTNRNDFLYGNFDMIPKKKKYNNFPYLQSTNDPPQTRSAKLRKQQSQNKSSREGSPSGSSTENKGGWENNKPSWMTSLPAGLSVEPVCSPTKKICIGCGRNDVRSLLVWCTMCCAWQHTGCGAEGHCAACGAPLPDPAPATPAPSSDPPPHSPHYQAYAADKVAERKRLQERNVQLCSQLRRLEARAASLQESMAEHGAEKRQLLADQRKTQHDLRRLLHFIGRFRHDVTADLPTADLPAAALSDDDHCSKCRFL